MNFIKCETCSRTLMYEEAAGHNCVLKIESVAYDTDDRNSYSIYDGKRWYPMKRHQPKGNRHKSTGDEQNRMKESD